MPLQRLCCAALFAAALSCPSWAAQFAWEPLDLKGMGAATGLVASPKSPHWIYARTREGGAYRWDRARSEWRLLTSSFPAERSVSAKVESIATSPRKPDRVYMATAARTVIVQHPQHGSIATPVGEVYVSEDAGETWAPTGMAGLADRVEMEGSGYMCWNTGERLAVGMDGTVWFASRYDGLLRLRPGGAWQRVAGLPDPEGLPGVSNGLGGLSKAGYSFVAVPYAPTLHASWVVVGVYGSGIWGSPDGGATWRQLTNWTNPVRCAVSPDGTVFASHTEGYGNGGRLVKIMPFGRRAIVADVTPAEVVAAGRPGLSGVAVDPAQPSNVFVQAGAGNDIYVSTNGGGSWTRQTQRESLARLDRPAYLPSTASSAWRSGIVVDPALGTADRLLQGNRYGVVASPASPVFGAGRRWILDGMPGAIVNDFAVAGGSAAIVALDDAVLIRAGQCTRRTFEQIPGVPEGTGVDASPTDPQFVVAVGGNDAGGGGFGGTSTDGGITFQPFGSLPSQTAQGGRVAVSYGDNDNIVWAPTNWHAVSYSRDGGKTWKAGGAAGSGAPLSSWQLLDMNWNGRVLAASRTRPNTFYFFMFGLFHASYDGGATWIRIYDTNLPPNGVRMPLWAIETNIVPHPTNPDEIWMTFRHNDNDSLQYPTLYSVDGGYTWNRAPGVVSGNYIAFGQGSGSPWVYSHMILRVGNQDVEGLFRTKTPLNPSSWKLVSPPGRYFTNIRGLFADMRDPGVVYVTTMGGGVLVGRNSQGDD